MHEILPNLYLSNYGDACAAVKDGRDTFIVNCTKDFPMLRPGIRVAVDDDGSPESMDAMVVALPSVVAKIDAALIVGMRVIVHCLAGQQRSPAVISAYLMKTKKMSLVPTIQFIRSKKADAFFWAVNFRDALTRYSYTV